MKTAFIRKASPYVALAAWLAACGACVAQALVSTNFVTADNSIIDVDGERDYNMGAVSSIRLKTFQHHVVLKFDTSALSNRVVTGASLYAYEDNADELEHITVSTIQADWNEGTSGGFATSEGGSCLHYAAWSATESNRVAWAWPGSRFPDVAYGNAYARLDTCATVFGNDGNTYYRWDVDPDLVAASVAGAAYGLALFESSREVGLNRTIHSREHARKPFLVISSEPDTSTPGSITNLTGSADDADRGQVRLAWTAPEQAFAYRIVFSAQGSGLTNELPRYLIPYAAAAGAPETVLVDDVLVPGTTYTFAVRALSRGGKAGAEATVEVAASSIERSPGRNVRVPDPTASVSNGYADASLAVWAVPETQKVLPDGTFLADDAVTPAWKTGNPVFDGHSVRLYAARNEVAAFLLCLEAVGAPVSGLCVTLGEHTHLVSSLWRVGYIHTAEGLMPELCYPYSAPLATDMDENAATQTVQQVLVECFIAPETAAGAHSLSLSVTNGTGVSFAVPVDLYVWDFALPAVPGFVLEMNDYGYPNYLATYNALQRLARHDRAHVNLLSYTTSRTRMDMYFPAGGQMNETAYNAIGPGDTTTTWTDFVTAFDDLFSGALYDADPWPGVPVRGFYLTFHESWPLAYEPYYEPGGPDAATAFTNHPEYAQTFVNLLSNFVWLAESRSWTGASFQVYFNNKQHPWDFDEPYDFWDFRALAYYAGLFELGTARNGGIDIRYRVDISRPEYHRNQLDGLVDLAVVGRSFFTYHRLVRYLAERDGTEVWNYGTANDVYKSNHNEEAWPLLSYAFGARGILPWSTVKIGTEYLAGVPTGDLQKRALYIVASDSNSPEVYSTLRMKAFRRGAQDVEYLALAGSHVPLTGGQVRRMIVDAIGAHATVSVSDEYVEDAGTLEFEGLSEAPFFALRQRAARLILGQAAPFVPDARVVSDELLLTCDNLYTGTSCTLERCFDLKSNDWHSVTSFPAEAHVTNLVQTLPAGADQAYFRFQQPTGD
ncbi:MAG: hypothetical protein JXR37_18800 [Kiritimatiellae bacterium]|nr:hypothetical protein [Kiritimatiellia bacterium]